MSDKPGWLGRAQWMPIELSAPTPRTRILTALTLLIDVAVLVGAWIVAHATSSIEWGVVTGVAVVLLGLPILVLLARRSDQPGGT